MNSNKQNNNHIIGQIAATAADKAAHQATRSSGWLRWLWGLAAALAGAIAWFTTASEQQHPACTGSACHPTEQSTSAPEQTE
ncbi:MAG: hypothetical protein IJB33_04950 [Akkermansia sp.]|nr:hypothetical protein [Akkermansia sp.]MBQ7021998.1 hypothetical protein [Akkermansia sp.]